MGDCLFCRIAEGGTPTELLHEDELVVAFRDVAPQAPTHCLVIPRRHVPSLAAAAADDMPSLGRCIEVARELAERLGLCRRGYRLVLNTGVDGGQSVHHVHFHLLGGRQMHWPPG